MLVTNENNSINISTKINLNYDLYSFDIFDTLITRRTATPSGIFAIMQEYLKNSKLDEMIKCNFYNIRIASEINVREKRRQMERTSEVTFDEIYEMFKDNYKVSDEEVSYLKHLEIETEQKNFVPIEENILLIKYLLEQNKRVVLVSDMYYSKDILRAFLCKIDSVFKDIPIYVSSEYLCSKGDLRLFPKVAEIEKVKTSNWMHIGDNKLSDFTCAKKCGVNGVLYPYEKLLDNEQLLFEKYYTNSKYAATIGASRLTRLNNKHIKNKDKYDFGASFAGPILYNYIDYVLNISVKEGYKTLYFVARDGYIPKLIADVIIESRNLPIKTEYLYGSRKAWRLPTEKTYNDYIKTRFNKKISLEFLAYKLNLSVDELSKITNIQNTKEDLDIKKVLELEELFLNSDDIKNIVIDRNKKQVELLKKYMHQKINFDEKFAFVDINGSGSTIDILIDILEHKIDTFYIACSFSKTNKKAVHLLYEKKVAHGNILELLCRECNGQTVGYKDTANGVEPVFLPSNLEVMKKWGFDSYKQGVVDFCKNIELTRKINSLNFCALEIFKNYYGYFFTDCDKKTAEILAKIPFSFDEKEDYTEKQPIKYNAFWLLVGFLLNFQYYKYNNTPFIEKLSSPLALFMLNIVRKYQSLPKLIVNYRVDEEHKRAAIIILGIKISVARLVFKRK